MQKRSREYSSCDNADPLPSGPKKGSSTTSSSLSCSVTTTSTTATTTNTPPSSPSSSDLLCKDINETGSETSKERAKPNTAPSKPDLDQKEMCEKESKRDNSSPHVEEKDANASSKPLKRYCFDDFEVSRTLGTGSYGRVLLVKEKSTGQFFALKRLKKADIVRLKQVEHTNNERRLLSRVPDSPFAVSLISSFQDARYLYLLMEYVAGGELFGLLRRVRTLPSFVAQFYAAEIVLVLESLHSKNIIYRDLKPENVLLAADGHLRLADFGFAKIVPDITWTFCGTPEYLAPELVSASGAGYGRAVDWYALGVLIYEMVFGRPPFYHENHLKMYDQIAHDEPKFADTADQHAVSLMQGLLEKNPTKRLGVLKGGADDIKKHPWFKDISWSHLASRQVRPPYRPRVNGPGDASNFDKYPEDTDPPVSADETDDFGRLFPDF